LCRELSRFARHFQEIGKGQKFDVQMPADLDQFGGDNSHGAVIGGKGLVKLGHDPTDGRRVFQEVDVISGISQIKG